MTRLIVLQILDVRKFHETYKCIRIIFELKSRGGMFPDSLFFSR